MSTHPRAQPRWLPPVCQGDGWPIPARECFVGEIREHPEDGTVAVRVFDIVAADGCVTSGTPWRVVGDDLQQSVSYGWRSDAEVASWTVLGNVHDLTTPLEKPSDDTGHG